MSIFNTTDQSKGGRNVKSKQREVLKQPLKSETYTKPRVSFTGGYFCLLCPVVWGLVTSLSLEAVNGDQCAHVSNAVTEISVHM
jgi:hypothetical protein